MKKAKIVSITSAILASIYPLLALFGVEVTVEKWQIVTGGVVTLVGIIGSLFGESPAQGKIESARVELERKKAGSYTPF